MRLSTAALAIALLALSPRARAEPPAERNFWNWLMDPHAPEVAVVLEQAAENRAESQGSRAAFSPSGLNASEVINREAMLRQSIEMLRYALELKPSEPMLHFELAYATFETGDMLAAREALERYIALAYQDNVYGEARLMLAHCYAAIGRLRDAERELHLAAGSPWLDSSRGQPRAVATLAQLQMQRGQPGQAASLLAREIAGSPLSPSASAHPVLILSLAVAYDRDEQITRAADTLRDILATGRDNLAGALTDRHDHPLRFVVPADVHYFRALQFEAMGHLVEARQSWRAYADAPGARFRSRALAHLRALDTMAPSPPPKKAKK